MEIVFTIIAGALLVYIFIRECLKHSNRGVFVTRFEPSWYSEDFVTFKFSNDNGITWKYLLEVSPPLFSSDYSYSLKKRTYKLVAGGNLHHLNTEFNTYDKCIAYNQKMMDKCDRKNLELEVELKAKEKARREELEILNKR